MCRGKDPCNYNASFQKVRLKVEFCSILTLETAGSPSNGINCGGKTTLGKGSFEEQFDKEIAESLSWMKIEIQTE